jgi:hypothetical protein
MTLRRWLQRTLNRLRGVPLVLACLALGACETPDPMSHATAHPVEGVTTDVLLGTYVVDVLRIKDSSTGFTCYVAATGPQADIECVKAGAP